MENLKLFYFEPCLKITALCSAYLDIKPVGYYYTGESHDFFEVVFVLKGTVKATAGERVYEIDEGNLILHPKGEFHRIINESDSSVRIGIVTFDADFLSIDKHFICSFDNSGEIIQIIHNIRKAFKTEGIFVVGANEDHNPIETQIAICELERIILKAIRISSTQVNNARRDRTSELYSNAVAIMKRDLTTRLCACEIAELCRTSVSSLQKTFSRYAGVGVMQYYEQIRMQKARELLQDGASVKNTALRLGYDDMNYFSAAYKRFYGQSPRNDKK
ncbi:MAG: helix-turn-helix domain-containing protein [Ruminococcaceae bacterium]|nr:helix-turn-helix domain-containing protein [Oscillospiraceae bacterium]